MSTEIKNNLKERTSGHTTTCFVLGNGGWEFSSNYVRDKMHVEDKGAMSYIIIDFDGFLTLYF
jgi:hypothetical protein